MYSPVARSSTLRTILCLAALFECKLHGGDVPSAYVCADVDPDAKPIYISQPPGFVEKGNDFVWLMLKGIYGYPPAGRNWYNHLVESLLAFGFIRNDVDPCLFMIAESNGIMFLVAIVDDLTWFSTCTKLHECFVEYMCRKYDLKYFDTVDWLIGMQIKQDELFQVSLDQSDYVKSICQEYNHLV